ncbi:hypothetical protein [Hymenobacter guriensis]|uniref:WW domain-containing protein n=1 Tax=Hymenobacter guriensis TaxID=2793065 RepID=A0ABS0KX51_9BACT|nr:hypothetical protein [Hymenobacter guriensis]MBG8552345.1 hypothetical protein [Hymenobacter guriensis]
MNNTEIPISSTLPTSYTSWQECYAAARKAPEWKDDNPYILCTSHSLTSWVAPPVIVRYAKDYIKQQAQQEVESASERLKHTKNGQQG